MYGSQLWDLTSVSVKKMCTRWRIAHRQILSPPYNAALLDLQHNIDCMLIHLQWEEI